MTHKSPSCIFRFLKEARGGVALMAGLSFPLIFLAIGGTVDYSRSVSNTTKAQEAMDATILALTRMDTDTIDIQAEGEKLFNATLITRQLDIDLREAQFTQVGQKIIGTALIGNKTVFLSVFGTDAMDSRVRAEAIPPSRQPIEVALVLDVSGSMSEDLNGASRMDRLKVAVNEMFDTLDESLAPGTKLSASVVPYSSSVNLGDYSGALKSASLKGKTKPAIGDVWAAERLIASNGNKYTLDDSAPTGRGIPFVTADEMSYASPLARMSALTTTIEDVRNGVSNLVPDGWTAGHIGMIWGIYTLSPDWKNFWPAAPADYGKADKIIVLLSDGEFNTTFNIGDGMTGTDTSTQNDNRAEADAYFQDACALARNRGISIYAIALSLDAVSEQKLKDCVGGGGKLYSADTASELSAAFKGIALELGQRRLTG